MTRGLLILWIGTTIVLCWSAYQEGQINMMEGDLKMMKEYIENVERLENRIEAMQELIDYNEGVVNDAINLRYESGGKDKALDYLEKNYIIGDGGQDDGDECICRDENAYSEIWGED